MSIVKSNKKNKARLTRHQRGRPTLVYTNHSINPSRNNGLYAFVYQSLTAFTVSLILVFSFLFQGVYVVYANEYELGGEVVTVPVPSAPLNEEVTPSERAEEIVLDDGSTAMVNENILEDESIEENAPLEADPEIGVATGTSQDEPNTVEDEITTLPDPGGGVDDSVDENEQPSEALVDDSVGTSSSESEYAEDQTASSTDAASAEVIGPAIDVPITVTYSDSGYSFSKSECTELASGSFYCMEPQENVLEDALFAAPDADGDLEIFLVRDNVQTQVTDNFTDDAAPYYDQNSHSIVWHRLINDRYQIVTYDLEEGEEVIVTNSGTNNMEPTRQGKYTVWQRWVGNNWDIVLHDGVEERQISHSAAHDIAPYVHGTLVVWNRYTMTGEKTVEMYDIASQSYVTVDDPTGMTVSNPRMVLVYDQMHPNGDIVTKGYDMIARSFIALDTLPRDLPAEVPGSEPTSETRALIQIKPSLKGDELMVSDDIDESEPQIDPSVEGSSTDPLTLDLTLPSQSAEIESVTGSDLSEFDLIIEPLSIPAAIDDSAQATAS